MIEPKPPSSNGHNGHAHHTAEAPPQPSSEVREHLRRHGIKKHAEIDIDIQLATAVADLRAAYPDHQDVIAEKLDGHAETIRRERELAKRKERHANRSK